MVIPAGYRQCKTCNKQFKKWSTKDTANYCPSCNSSRLTKHESKVRPHSTWGFHGSKEKDEIIKKTQERKNITNKRYWAEQKKRKDPDYIPKKKGRNHPNYFLNKKPVSFDDIMKRKKEVKK